MRRCDNAATHVSVAARTPLLPKLVWLEIHRPGLKQGHSVHAVRGGHTLCGITKWHTTRAGSTSELPRCSLCVAVPKGHATAHDLVEFAGLTYKQADYWSRAEFLKARNPACGSGFRRTWPPEEFAVAEVMRRLTDAGVTPPGAATAARNDGWLTPDVRVTWS